MIHDKLKNAILVGIATATIFKLGLFVLEVAFDRFSSGFLGGSGIYSYIVPFYLSALTYLLLVWRKPSDQQERMNSLVRQIKIGLVLFPLFVIVVTLLIRLISSNGV
jgi:hypothetical protein